MRLFGNSKSNSALKQVMTFQFLKRSLFRNKKRSRDHLEVISLIRNEHLTTHKFHFRNVYSNIVFRIDNVNFQFVLFNNNLISISFPSF